MGKNYFQIELRCKFENYRIEKNGDENRVNLFSWKGTIWQKLMKKIHYIVKDHSTIEYLLLIIYTFNAY